MPETINWPMQAKTNGPRPRGVLALIVLFLVLVFGSRMAVSFWVDLLWFRSLGYGGVFWKTRGLNWGVFALFAAATFLILAAVFAALKRAHAPQMPATHTVYLGGQEFHLPVGKALRAIGAAVAAVVALATGGTMASQWPVLALYWYAQGKGAGPADPIFGRPLGFYLFTLPAWQLLSGWLLTLAVIAAIASVLFLLISGSARALTGRLGELPLRGLCLSGGSLLLVLAARVYIGRFELLFAHHTVFDGGVTYTDAHITATGLLLVSLALVLGAAIAFAAVAKPRVRWLAGAVAPAAVCYVLVMLAGWYTTTFIVKPNELDRERPYIRNNIAMTRQAYGLDRFAQSEFLAETDPGAADPADNQATLDNIRLWDVQALRDTLRQVQEIRTYYDFPDIDIDRYRLGGSLRQVMLAARELNVDKLPENSRNWINEKLIYTHGYGVTMNPVNGFTPEGLPALMLSNMPVQSTVPDLKVTRPEIYFGEMTDTDVYVKTNQREFNYPEGQTNNLNTYKGTGGVEMGGFLRRVLLAFARGDLTKVPFSDDIGPQSRLLMHRDVRERVAALAPFLTFDRDPYIVVGDDGRLTWLMDGFTMSDTYPYSAHHDLDGQRVNYVRNSVKVAVDAYNGTVTFYVFDREDPIIAAWQRLLPELFKDASQMPAGLRQHVRYPELLLSLQAQVYGLYHMTNPEVFYNREDQWNVATRTGQTDGDQAEPMEPNFVLMKLPGGTGLEFVEILPFTPFGRTNMIGWIAARSDGEHYGTAVVYDFPKTRLVDGPQQIEARINQNAELSGQLTLWDQKGSQVHRGNLLVIPCGKALLYAEPIYLQAASSPMPELRMVVLALQDRLAYAPTFAEALTSLFGSEVPTGAAQSPGTPAQTAGQSASAGSAAESVKSLAAEADRDFSDYQRLTSAGKLAEAGQKLDDLKRVLSRLNATAK